MTNKQIDKVTLRLVRQIGPINAMHVADKLVLEFGLPVWSEAWGCAHHSLARLEKAGFIQRVNAVNFRAINR